MSAHLRWLLAGALLLTGAAVLPRADRSARAGEKEELVENPFYKHWTGFKKGSTAVYVETTRLGGAAKGAPDGRDEKTITYKLLSVNDKAATVEAVVREREFFGYVQAAPTRHIYPAKVSKAQLDRFAEETGAKKGEAVVKLKDKELKCMTVEGTIKAPGGEETEYKVWLADEVPGHIVKKIRTTRQKGEVIAETKITLKSYKSAE